MKLRAFFRFEFVYQARRVSTWLCVAVFGFAFLLGRSTPANGQWLNSPFGLAFGTVLAGAIWLLIAASVGSRLASGAHPPGAAQPARRS